MSKLGAKMTWAVETSHMVDIPLAYEARTIKDLELQVQATANSKKTRSDRPPIGPLTFKLEHDDLNRPLLLHAAFIGRDGKKRRFMRLRRKYAEG